MIGTLLGAVLPALVSGAASWFGGERQNAANAQQAQNQMTFQAGESAASQEFAREMYLRNQQDQQRMYNINNEYNQQLLARQEQFQLAGVRNQQDFQRETLNSAMAYNTEMANTSYQRGMADMKAAGLNPILAYRQGGATSPNVGAPSSNAPGGALPMASSPGSPGMASRPAMSGAQARMENALAPAVASALQGATVVGNAQQALASADRTKAETALIGQQQVQVQANTALQMAQAITEGVRPDLLRATLRSELMRPGLIGAQTHQAATSAQSTAQEVERFRNYGPRGTIPDALASGEAVARRAHGSPTVSGAIDRGRALLDSIFQSLR